MDRYDRTRSLIGDEAFDKLTKKTVTVVGLGGVGGAAFEVLLRTGVNLVAIDGDDFDVTNLNRQILSTDGNIGISKAEAAKLRASLVNPSLSVKAVGEFIGEDNVDAHIRDCDYVVDAIDDMQNKLLLIKTCKRKGIPIVSACGAGNRLSADFKVCDIFETTNDPLAKIMRKKLREEGITSLTVVAANSPPEIKSACPASVAAPPMVMGAIMAGHVVKELLL